MVDGVFDTMDGDPAYRARVVRTIIDNLVGNDPRAIVSNIKGLPADMVELVTDAIFDAIEAAALKRFSPPAADV
jgi:hypothetical protein